MIGRAARFVADSVTGSGVRNDDATLVLESAQIAAVFDGMSSMRAAAGELARELFIEAYHATVAHTAELRAPPGAELLLRESIVRANALFCERARRDVALQGSGATICAIGFEGDDAVIAHAGECRAYALTVEGELHSCTLDHTLAQERLLLEGSATREQLASIEGSMHLIVTRSLGLSETMAPDIAIERAPPTTVFLLCTNGLHLRAQHEELRSALVLARGDLAAASARLRRIVAQSDHWDDASWVIAVVQ
ncbi:MAG: protein phosphatase 2C domain-containing protein [Polyangiales bacterium]